MGRVSVIVPSYNSAKTLALLAEALARQTCPCHETILVDDCSTDGSIQIARRQFDTVLRTASQGGPAKARNMGIGAAEGDILAFTDSDCIPDIGWVENIAKRLEDPATDVVMGRVRLGRGGVLADSISCLGFPAGGTLGFEKRWPVSPDGWTSHLSSCNFAARRLLFEDIGGFDERFYLAGGEDSELSHRLIDRGKTIRYCPDIVVTHPPRGELIGFVRWHVNRGRMSRVYKEVVKDVGPDVSARLRSMRGILGCALRTWKGPIILALLLLSTAAQGAGLLLGGPGESHTGDS